MSGSGYHQTGGLLLCGQRFPTFSGRLEPGELDVERVRALAFGDRCGNQRGNNGTIPSAEGERMASADSVPLEGGVH